MYVQLPMVVDIKSHIRQNAGFVASSSRHVCYITMWNTHFGELGLIFMHGSHVDANEKGICTVHICMAESLESLHGGYFKRDFFRRSWDIGKGNEKATYCLREIAPPNALNTVTNFFLLFYTAFSPSPFPFLGIAIFYRYASSLILSIIVSK
jgi:hypothetical protein